MLNIKPSQKSCSLQFVSSIVSLLASDPQLRKTEIGKELKNE